MFANPWVTFALALSLFGGGAYSGYWVTNNYYLAKQVAVKQAIIDDLQEQVANRNEALEFASKQALADAEALRKMKEKHNAILALIEKRACLTATDVERLRDGW